MARRWAAEGAARLHVVDLDGAFSGAPQQTGLIAAIVEAIYPVPVEAGGGLRDLDAIETLLKAGVTWAVLGTRAAVDATFLTDACQRFPGRIIVAADGRGDRVAIRGWTEASELTVVELGRRAGDAGADALLYTDVSRDGTELGPNVEATAILARSVNVPVLASGGVGTVEHLRILSTVPGVVGAVVGRALYSGAFSLTDALAAAGGA